jgi:hypothetical protein
MDSLSTGNGSDNSVSSTKVDLLHPGVNPAGLASAATPAPAPAPVVPSSSGISQPVVPPQPPPVKSSRGHWPILVALAVLTLVIAGGGAYWLLVLRTQSTQEETSPAVVEISNTKPADLTQSAGGGNVIRIGGATNKTDLVFSFRRPADTEFTPEVEVVPVLTPFQNSPTSGTVSGSGTAVGVSVAGLAEGAYHWQARLAKGQEKGPWVSFGNNVEDVADFIIDTTVPAAPVISSIGGKPLGSGTTIITSNRPVFIGTAEPSAGVKLDLNPGPATLQATADDSGAWSVTPDSDIPNGNHSLIVVATDGAGNVSPAANHQLAINAAQASVTPPPPPASVTPPSAVAPPPPSQPTELAKTGDNPAVSIWLGCLALVISLGGLVVARRHA